MNEYHNTHSSQPKFDAEDFLAHAPKSPGVYVFVGENSQTLYIGKAKNLRARLSSYFKKTGVSHKTRVMVGKITNAEIHTSPTERHALLLEHDMIKDRKPVYNIIFRDDKSFPYIRLKGGESPRFELYRGKRKSDSLYFGPYPSTQAVKQTLEIIYKAFKLRQCNDAMFRNRSRPCLQYQINRCSAPCVGFIDTTSYNEDVRQARNLLSGQFSEVLQELTVAMNKSSEKLNYEEAAKFRDRIQTLRYIQGSDDESGIQNLDIISIELEANVVCFGVNAIRQGKHLGSRFYVKKNILELTSKDLLEYFIVQHYLEIKPPPMILLNTTISNTKIIEKTLSSQHRFRVKIKSKSTKASQNLSLRSQQDTASHLKRHLAAYAHTDSQFDELQKLLSMEQKINRIECFDISHHLGEHTVGSAVVFDRQGPRKSDYRIYKIKKSPAGDDYASMQELLMRRFEEQTNNSFQRTLPELILIDGGRGQLNIAKKVMSTQGLSEKIFLAGVAKGENRESGKEKIYTNLSATAIIPSSSSLASHLIQKIRDEAHRFAITGNRRLMQKTRNRSILEDISGVGAKRRKALLLYFGGIRGLKQAGEEDIKQVPGISSELANRIYNSLHSH